mgnify:CR=1 FL=1|jgi:hypothetical protein
MVLNKIDLVHITIIFYFFMAIPYHLDKSHNIQEEDEDNNISLSFQKIGIDDKSQNIIQHINANNNYSTIKKPNNIRAHINFNAHTTDNVNNDITDVNNDITDTNNDNEIIYANGNIQKTYALYLQNENEILKTEIKHRTTIIDMLLNQTKMLQQNDNSK